MRALLAFGCLVASVTVGICSSLIPGELTTTDAVALVGVAVVVTLAAIALGLRDIAIATRQRIVWEDLAEQKREKARRG